MGADVFAVSIFFICLRECLETTIIVSILLSFLKQALPPSSSQLNKTLHRRLVKQVWWGTGLGLLICIIIGAGLIGAFYSLNNDIWSKTEDLWEGIFGLIATIVITLMGAALLRVSKLQDKWKVKLAKALESKAERQKDGTSQTESRGTRYKRWAERYAMFILPFITVLREGLEAVVFIGGVSLGIPATAIPLAVVCGLAAGILIGFFIYKGGNMAKIQYFLIVSTCFLYLVAAGLFSKAVWAFQTNNWNKIVDSDADSLGSGPGSYDISQSVWHVNCCNPELNDNSSGGWGIFNAILGWTNSATYGSVISYNVYWIAVAIAFMLMRYAEKRGWGADVDHTRGGVKGLVARRLRERFLRKRTVSAQDDVEEGRYDEDLHDDEKVPSKQNVQVMERQGSDSDMSESDRRRIARGEILPTHASASTPPPHQQTLVEAAEVEAQRNDL